MSFVDGFLNLFKVQDDDYDDDYDYDEDFDDDDEFFDDDEYDDDYEEKPKRSLYHKST